MGLSWKDVQGAIADAAPLLGTLVGGPAGGAIGGMVAAALGVKNNPDDVAEALKTDPDAAVKLAQVQANNQVQLQSLAVQAEQNRLAAESTATQSVNNTMQSEDKSDHWPTYTWRPFIGICVGINTLVASLLTIIVYGGVMLGSKQAADALTTLPMVIGALAAISGTMLPILGIASWFRGKAQADPTQNVDMRG
jgi:hypothetical protein